MSTQVKEPPYLAKWQHVITLGLGAVSTIVAVLAVLQAFGAAERARLAEEALNNRIACRYSVGSKKKWNKVPNTGYLSFSRREYDSHDAVSDNNGWSFRAPLSGLYLIGASARISSRNADGDSGVGLPRSARLYLEHHAAGGGAPRGSTLAHAIYPLHTDTKLDSVVVAGTVSRFLGKGDRVQFQLNCELQEKQSLFLDNDYAGSNCWVQYIRPGPKGMQ